MSNTLSTAYLKKQNKTTLQELHKLVTGREPDAAFTNKQLVEVLELAELDEDQAAQVTEEFGAVAIDGAPSEDGPAPKVKAKAAKEEITGYEKWRVRITADGSIKKLEKLRDNVKISDEHAERANNRFTVNSVNPIMYFKPE